MKNNIYYLVENDKVIARSYKMEYVLNKTVKTKDGKIFYNGCLVWTQNPDKYFLEN